MTTADNTTGAFVGQDSDLTLYGRQTDMKDVLALLDDNRVVAVVGSRGFGKTLLMETIATLYKIDCLKGTTPTFVQRGDLIVLDDAASIGSKAMISLVRRTLKAHGRIVLSLRSESEVPGGAAIYRLREIDPAASLALLKANCECSDEMAKTVLRRIGGHPGLILSVAAIIDDMSEDDPSADEVLSILGRQLREEWLESIPKLHQSTAVKLMLAGGWLPLDTEDEEYGRCVDFLVRQGLAERDEDHVVASPLLVVAAYERPDNQSLERILGFIRSYAWIDHHPLARLAEAHLLFRLGREAQSLQAIRTAYRASRGGAREDAYIRSLRVLSFEKAALVADAACLAIEIRGNRAWWEPLADTDPLAELMEKGNLLPEEELEAKIAITCRRSIVQETEHVMRELSKLASVASTMGNYYGEAHALLWGAWLSGSSEDHEVSRNLATKAVKLARQTEAPTLWERALLCLSRSDIAEGDLDGASKRLEQALRLCKRYRLDEDQIVILDALADVAGRVGRPSEAAEYLDAADLLVARTGSIKRRAELAVTRAEVAMRRGHAGRAAKILASKLLQVMDDGWRRDLLSAEVAVATGNFVGAMDLLSSMRRPAIPTRAWRRRVALVASALIDEGFEPAVDLSVCEEDPIATLRLVQAKGDKEATAKLLKELSETVTEDDAEGVLLLRSESARAAFFSGSLDEGLAKLLELREFLVKQGPSTALMLNIEALENLIHGEAYASATNAISAYFSARSLGHERLALYSLECLILAHLAMGRVRGLRFILARYLRKVRQFGSTTREARLGLYRAAAAIRSGLPAELSDLEEARKSVDPLVTALADIIAPTDPDVLKDVEPSSPLATRLRELVIEGGSSAWTSTEERPQGAVELFVDGDKRDVTLAGGKKIHFSRRRVLWRLLWLLAESEGESVEPAILYRAAWELPFNQSRLNSLYVGVRRLRLLVEPDPSSPRIILASPNGGYYMDERRVSYKGASPFAGE